MKKIILLSLCCILISGSYARANANADSLAYQLQRKKINGMLAQRKLKFGQYDQSLTQHTGIFGLQTKKDIRHSNDILMDIVKTDDDILMQTKILLEYRTFEQTQVQTRSQETDNSNIGFMNAINRLRNENDKLKQQLQAADEQQQKKSQVALGFIIALLVIVLLLLRARFVKKS